MAHGQKRTENIFVQGVTVDGAHLLHCAILRYRNTLIMMIINILQYVYMCIGRWCVNRAREVSEDDEEAIQQSTPPEHSKPV